MAIVISVLYTTLLAAAPVDVASIAKKFEKLGEWQLPQTPDYTIYDPFRRAEPLIRQAKAVKRKPKPITLRITAIMNDRAFVNGRWVRSGDRIGEYKVVGIRSRGIVLKAHNRTLFLPMREKKRLLKVKEPEQ